MKILVVSHFYESHRGGIEIVAGRLARELRYLGHDLRWAASTSDPAPLDIAAAPLPTVDFVERIAGLPMPIPKPTGIWRLVNEVRAADAVIVHDGLYVTSILAMLAARFLRKPVLIVQHIAEIPFQSALLTKVMRLANRLVTGPMLRAADQALFISETTAAHFAHVRFHRPPLLAFNGVDAAMFRPAVPEEKQGARADFGFRSMAPLALFVGRFVEKKGLSVLRALAAQRPDIQFAMAGWGPIDPARWDLPNVSVFGSLSGERLASLYRASDLLVLPSVGEGFPLVIQEALATNLPVVCGSQSAAADAAAKPLLLGIPVDLANPEATAADFSKALDEALALPTSVARVEHARIHYSWQAAAQLYDASIRQLMVNAPAAAYAPELEQV